MTRLILLNGAPGSGKSTLARRYAEDHPLTLDLDLDVVRSLLGGWLDEPGEAGILTRRMAVEMARTHLGAGRDVVVPQYLGRLDFVARLDELCREVGAEFVEVALMTDEREAVDRFAGRSRDEPRHRDAADLQARLGGVEALPDMRARMLAVCAARPRTRFVPSVRNEIDRTYADFLRAVT